MLYGIKADNQHYTESHIVNKSISCPDKHIWIIRLAVSHQNNKKTNYWAVYIVVCLLDGKPTYDKLCYNPTHIV